MKTIRIFLVAVLLGASTTLMAKNNVRPFEKSMVVNQTEQMIKDLDLSKKQVNKILAISKKYARKDALLFAQRREIQRMGYMDGNVQRIFMETLSVRSDAKNKEIKTILNDEQWAAFENMLPTMRKAPFEPTQFMRERNQENDHS